MPGLGLCTYDAASATGVMMVLHLQTVSPFDMEFSLRETGVQPQGLDGEGPDDADSRADGIPADAGRRAGDGRAGLHRVAGDD